jgi:hypothetical protein
MDHSFFQTIIDDHSHTHSPCHLLSPILPHLLTCTLYIVTCSQPLHYITKMQKVNMPLSSSPSTGATDAGTDAYDVNLMVLLRAELDKYDEKTTVYDDAQIQERLRSIIREYNKDKALKFALQSMNVSNIKDTALSTPTSLKEEKKADAADVNFPKLAAAAPLPPSSITTTIVTPAPNATATAAVQAATAPPLSSHSVVSAEPKQQQQPSAAAAVKPVAVKPAIPQQEKKPKAPTCTRCGSTNGSHEYKHCLAYKTRMCEYFKKGKCNRGSKCTFAHGQSELRDISHLYCSQVIKGVEYGCGGTHVIDYCQNRWCGACKTNNHWHGQCGECSICQGAHFTKQCGQYVRPIRCKMCGANGHESESCSVRCFHCQNTGHSGNTCRYVSERERNRNRSEW